MTRSTWLGATIILAAAATPAATANGVIITWPGNTAEWNRRLGVDELRLGCKYEFPRCVASMRRKLRDEGEAAATIAIVGDPRKTAADAAEYSNLSVEEPRLRGVGIDDFVSVLAHWRKDGLLPDGATPALKTILNSAHSRNPQLTFGITLYESELASPLLRDAVLSREVKGRVGRVTLYLHYRENGRNYADYVRQVRQMFPHAQVIAGIYAYDRVDYAPCAGKGRPNCSAQSELSLFKDTLITQMSLLADKRVDGVELYPGYYGAEDSWPALGKPNICRPERRAECLATMLKMRELVEQALQHRQDAP